MLVKGLPISFNFLTKKKGHWIGKYKLPQGTYNYKFVVDGKDVLDTKTPIKITASIYEDWYRSHQLCIDIGEESFQTKIKVIVPNKTDVIYISGNQRNLTNWNPIFRLKKVSDFEREITLDLHYPAKFKFTRDNSAEAIILGNQKDKKGKWLPMEINSKSTNFNYKVIDWENKNH